MDAQALGIKRNTQMKTNPPPWNAKAAAQIEFQYHRRKSRSPASFVRELPTGSDARMDARHAQRDGNIVHPGQSHDAW